MHYFYPILAVIAVLLILAARLLRYRRYSSRIGRVDGVEWKIRRNSYLLEKRAKR